jgi:hypothetical protein
MDLTSFYNSYGKEKVDLAIEKLNYKEVTTMPKDENPNFPIIYIFRHGQSEDNLEMIFSGWRDPKLTEKGVEQALELAEKIKDKKIIFIPSTFFDSTINHPDFKSFLKKLTSRDLNLTLVQSLSSKVIF